MEPKKTYAKRVIFTEEQQKIILENYHKCSASQILALLQQNDPTKNFNQQMVYGFLRRVKREAKKSINTLIEHNAQEAAEKLKHNINHIIPDKRNNSANAIIAFLNNLNL